MTIYLHTKNHSFQPYDIDLDPMTFIFELDLDIMKMYLHTKNEVPRSRHSNVRTQTDTYTDTHIDTTEHITFCIRGR